MKQLLDRIKTAFEPGEEAQPHSEEDLRLAASVLMVELSRADYEVEESERAAVRHAVEHAFGLSESETDELIRAAETEADAAVSFYRYTELINAHWGPQEKARLIEALWRIALSDSDMHHFEEHLVRKLAGLLHVPHREFLKAKHRVQQNDE